MASKQKSQAMRAAVIGLIGTMLAACGGLGSTVIGEPLVLSVLSAVI